MTKSATTETTTNAAATRRRANKTQTYRAQFTLRLAATTTTTTSIGSHRRDGHREHVHPVQERLDTVEGRGAETSGHLPAALRVQVEDSFETDTVQPGIETRVVLAQMTDPDDTGADHAAHTTTPRSDSRMKPIISPTSGTSPHSRSAFSRPASRGNPERNMVR